MLLSIYIYIYNLYVYINVLSIAHDTVQQIHYAAKSHANLSLHILVIYLSVKASPLVHSWFKKCIVR